MDNIVYLMENGWDVHIECKGAHREFSMTFEASAKHQDKLFPLHAVGDTLDELGDNLMKFYKEFEGVV